jgi:hypothetical protein
MAICNIFEAPGRTREELERIETQLRSTGPVPPDGCRLVLIGVEHAITVWDSKADCEAFVDGRLRPAYESLGLSLDALERKQFEVETLVAGDLVGAPG